MSAQVGPCPPTEPPGELAVEDIDEPATPRDAPAAAQKPVLRKSLTNAANLLKTTSKVAMENKVGIEPEGDAKEVALALHSGFGAALGAVADADPTTKSKVTAVDAEQFESVRKAFGISEASFAASICLQPGRAESNLRTIPLGMTSGKSSSFFFFSPDQHYIFKTCTPTDVKSIRRALGEYTKHVQAHPGSLLPRYVGLFSLAMPSRPVLPFVCMSNAFGGQYAIQRRFDLKGSTHGRRASDKERGKKRPVFKDNDWLDDSRRLVFKDGASRDDFLGSIERDAAFLARMNLIDYSLLVGVHTRDVEKRAEYAKVERTPGITVLEDEETIMYICIVDVLTPYGVRKWLETFFLGTCFGGRDVSCQPAKKYAKRFVRFAKRISQQSSAGGLDEVFRRLDLAEAAQKAQAGEIAALRAEVARLK